MVKEQSSSLPLTSSEADSPAPEPVSVRSSYKAGGPPRDVATRRFDPAAVPVWFGDPSARLAGFYHPPAGAPRRAAVVLCSPFGYEKMSSYRALRHLAWLLAAEGFAVLRFDYRGTGDSDGADEAGELAEHWVDDVAAAKREVLERSGATTAILMGLRLGALLAAAEAARAPVGDLILIAPPVTGRAYVREMRAFQLLRAGSKPSVVHEGAVLHPAEADSFAGYPLSGQARSILAQIDLTKLSARPAKHVFLAARDDLASGADRISTALSELGARVTWAGTSGYAEMMQDDPYKSVVPYDLWIQVMEWAARWHPRQVLEPSPTLPFVAQAEVVIEGGPSVVEELVTFEGMHGVLSGPASPGARASTSIFLLNTGANHRIGSNRMYVRMARAWGSLGFRVLRFDLRGIGDSPPASGKPENDVYSNSGIADVRTAMDFMAARGTDRFVLAGLCSGAYMAYHTALVDPRVHGIILVNPLTFHWNEGDSLEVRTRQTFKSSRFYARALVDRDEWRRALRGELHILAVASELATRVGRRAVSLLHSAAVRAKGGDPEVSDVAKGFRDLCARGVDCLLVFGADDSGIDVIEQHLGVGARKLRKEAAFTMRIIDGPDHTFTPLWSQRYLRELLTEHLVGRFGGKSG